VLKETVITHEHAIKDLKKQTMTPEEKKQYEESGDKRL